MVCYFDGKDQWITERLRQFICILLSYYNTYQGTSRIL